MTPLDDTLKYLYDLQFFGMKLGLENTYQLLKLFNDPHRQYPTIHVAGTNGKGSTCAMIVSILQAHGRKTGLYTSPHIQKFSERIRIDGQEISDADIIRLTEKMRRTIDTLRCTFFEATTVMAFQYFAENQIDIGVIETGLGGRLDATNVVIPEISVITNIGLDHTEHLGNHLSAIAREKAGIIKDGVPCLVGSVAEELKPIFQKIADERHAELYFLDEIVQTKNVRLSEEGSKVDLYLKISGEASAYKDLVIGLPGQYQIHNAALAAATALMLKKISITETSIREGLLKATWKGRLQIISRHPFILADAAHNPMGMQKLRECIETIYRPKFRRLILLIGMLADKDFESCAEAVGGIFETIYTVTPNNPRALKAETLAEAMMKKNQNVFIGTSISETLEKIKAGMTDQDLLVITGSHFVLSEITGVV